MEELPEEGINVAIGLPIAVAEIRQNFAADVGRRIRFHSGHRLQAPELVCTGVSADGTSFAMTRRQAGSSRYWRSFTMPVCTENSDTDVLVMQPADERSRRNPPDPLNRTR